MIRVGRFEKVSYEQFAADMRACFPEISDNEILKCYDEIKLPCRATKGSAGYDFYSPIDFALRPESSVCFPTGIRVKIDSGWFLGCFPRSSMGMKYRLQLDNTIGIIDSDYYNSDNEGHIMVKLTNDGKQGRTATVKAGERFMQGIFLMHGITTDDDVTKRRYGGYGSTGK